MEVRIHDEAGLFNAGDIAKLQAADLPFELHVVTVTSNIDARVHAEVDGPNVVAIGVDATHHRVVAHYGNGTGIGPSHWAEVVAAGKSDLHDAHWADGVLKIAGRAAQSRTTATVAVNSHHESSSHTGLWIFGGVVLAVAAVCGFLWWRARRKEREFQNRAREISGTPYRTAGTVATEEPARVYTSSPTGSPSTVVVNQSSNNDLLTGYMIGSMSQPHHTHTVVHETPSYSSSSSSYSSSSSWDSGSSGFDFGGGFDMGGGGSDF